MALSSLNVLHPPTSVSLRFFPPSIALFRTHHASLLPKKRRFTVCLVFSSQSGSPAFPDEDPFRSNHQQVDSTGDEVVNSPREMNSEDLKLNSTGSTSENGAVDSPSTSSVSSPKIDPLVHQEQMRETLDGLSQSLALLSSTINDMSAAVRALSATLGAEQFELSSRLETKHSSIDLTHKPRPDTIRSIPEPFDPSQSYGISDFEPSASPEAADRDTVSTDDMVPPHLVEQNTRAHNLAYKLQQTFIQARIEGLGKPFQVAVDEFVDTCIDAHTLGLGLKELQLQLVLQDGSLTGAFAIRNQRWSNDPIMTEEGRIRSLWVRLVYSTLSQLEATEIEKEEADPTDMFVKEVLQLALENGFDLERIKLEQAFAGSDLTSGAVKAIRENQYIILLTLEKANTMKK